MNKATCSYFSQPSVERSSAGFLHAFAAWSRHTTCTLFTIVKLFRTEGKCLTHSPFLSAVVSIKYTFSVNDIRGCFAGSSHTNKIQTTVVMIPIAPEERQKLESSTDLLFWHLRSFYCTACASVDEAFRPKTMFGLPLHMQKQKKVLDKMYQTRRTLKAIRRQSHTRIGSQ